MRRIRYAMFGGSKDAFIGEVHRVGASFNHQIDLVAGCFSRNEKVNEETGIYLNLDKDRLYKDYQEMAHKESLRKDDRIDFVAIVTPNDTHYLAAKAFLEKGFHVLCEKPLSFTVEEAIELKELAISKNLLFAVAYAYQSYAMIPYMKNLIKDGVIGDILTIDSRYIQGWLLEDAIHHSNEKKPWRMDPKFSGISNSVGDIGTHIEYMVRYLTDLKVKRVSAFGDTFGNELDVNTMMHVEYENGVKGRYWVSQIVWGKHNDFNIQIIGSKGVLEWNQETPDVVYLTKRGESRQKLVRGELHLNNGNHKLGRVPVGHPEGYHICFANLYEKFIHAIYDYDLKKENPLLLNDVPSVDDGLLGVKFVEATIESFKNDSKWVKIK